MVKKIENLGFGFMALGIGAIIAAIVFIPLQPTFVPEAKAVIVKAVPAFSLSAREHVLIAAYRHGWTGTEWNCLVKIINIENPGWLPNRKNPDSTASGLFQVLRSASGVVFSSYSVADQARLGAKYIAYRYQNPCRALTFHLANGYF